MSDYIGQIQTMTENAAKWKAAHPNSSASIQFNFPDKVFLIQPISEAIAKHTVSTNAEGLELLKALWPDWDTDTEPTVNMCRVALEYEGKQKRAEDAVTPVNECPHCLHRTDRASGVGDNTPPSPGDLSVCINCAGVTRFDDNMHLVIVNNDEFGALPPDTKEQISKIVFAVRAMQTARQDSGLGVGARPTL